MIFQLLILALFLLILPTVIGSLATSEKNLMFRWICGQFFLWAGFQVICVPLILAERYFGDVVILFAGYTAAIALWAVAVSLRRKAKVSLRPVKGNEKAEYGVILLWVIFWGILVFQLIQAVRMTYADGDDAFYVAVSAITQDAGTMYQKMPYTGGTTELDTRHGLAPFPIWITFLARMSGMPAVTVAHVALPVALIPMTYAIFYLLGKRLFHGRDGRLPLFLVFTEILVLFGDYSFQSVENFMIARSRQGKAALGSIVIPFTLYLLLLICQRLKEKKSVDPELYLLLASASLTGCLCSTLGSLLICMLTGVSAAVMAVLYKRWMILLPMAACCLPCVGFALGYLILN